MDNLPDQFDNFMTRFKRSMGASLLCHVTILKNPNVKSFPNFIVFVCIWVSLFNETLNL